MLNEIFRMATFFQIFIYLSKSFFGVSALKKTYYKIHCSLDRYTTILNDPFFHAFFVLKLPNAYNLNSLGGRMVFLDTAVLVHIICE